MLNLKLINAVWFVGCGFFLRLRLAYLQYNWVFFNRYRDNFFFVLWQIEILILFVETAPRITNRASYRLYSTCISRLFSKTFSRRIRWTWGRFSPRHLAKSGRGLYFPGYNPKTSSTKSNYFISTGSTTFYLFYISLDRRKARITSKFAHTNYCLSSLNIYRYFFFYV